MSSLIYKCSESMGDLHWETQVYLSEGKVEISFIKNCFDGTKVITKQNVILTTEELSKIVSIMEKERRK